MRKARPVSPYPLDFEQAMRGLLAVPKEAVEHVKPKAKSENRKARKAKH
jgi:hypothetical protein